MKLRNSALRRVLLLATLAQGAGVLSLSAEEAFAAAPDEESVPSGTGVEEVVVTAQRRAEKIIDVPITITSMSGDDLKALGVANVKDLAAVVPGLVFSSQGTAAQPSIRGVSTTLTGPGSPGPVAIYVDGLYQSDQIGGTFDLPDISRIEVLKGPQGALYGRNATGGAILVTTQNPSFTPTGSITVGNGVFFGGSANTSNHFQTQGFLSGPIIADKVAGSISASFEDTPGYMTNDLSGGAFGKIRSEVFRAKLLIKPTDDIKILLSGSYADRRDDATQAFPLRTLDSLYPGSVIPTQPWHTTSELVAGGEYFDTIRRDVSAKVDWSPAGVGTLTYLVGLTQVRPLVNQDVDSAYAPACLATVFNCITPFVLWEPDNTFQQELTFASEKWYGFSFIVGALYLHDREGSFNNINPPITAAPIRPYQDFGYFSFESNVRTDAYAAYFEGTYNVTDALAVIAGARYSDETKSGLAREALFTFSAPTGPYTSIPPGSAPTDVAITPRFSLRYTLDPSTNVFASYNRGFKSSVLTNLSLTAPPAKPEKIDSFEAGIKHAGDRLSFDASAFYYDYRDLQVQFYTGITTITQNAASAKSAGLDLSSSFRATSDFKLQLSASWIPYGKYSSFANGVDFALPFTPAGLNQVTVNATGNRILRDPEFTGDLTGDYSRDLPWGQLNATATLYYSSAYDWDLLRRVETRAYTTLNSQVSLIPPGSNFQYTLYGKNLTNKVYINGFVGGATGDSVYYAAPREVGVKVNYKF